jgi:hypothetical protein
MLGLFIALTIVVHIPAVQYAMGWTHPDGTGACPFGYDKARTAAATARTPRVGRPALGFTLAATTRDDLLAWANQHQIKCEARHGKRALECTEAATTTWFELDDTGLLMTIKTTRRKNTAREVATAFTATESLLRARIGEPTLASGDTAELALGAFRQAMVEHRYADYRAQVRATNMGNGYILTESYTAL